MQRVLVPIRTILRDRQLVVLLGCSFLLGLASSFVAPFLSMFGTIEVGMSPVVFSVFMTATSLSAVVIGTVLARQSDRRWSRRALLVAGGASGAIGYAGYAFVRDPVWLIVVGSLALGIASITFSQVFAMAREQLVRSDVPETDAPIYVNVFRLVFALAWTAGPAVASWVLIQTGYRGTFLAAAVLFVLFGAAILAFVPDAPRLGVPARAAMSLRESLLRGGVLAHFAGFALVFAATTVSMMNLPLMVLQTLGGNERDVGIIYSVAPFFEIPFMFVFGVLASRGDQARLIRWSVALCVLYFALLGAVRAPWHIYPLQVASAAITAVVGGVAITFFQNFMPDQVGTATNLYTTAQRIGSTLGFVSFGGLVTALGHRLVFAVCAAACALALALLWIFRPRVAAAG